MDMKLKLDHDKNDLIEAFGVSNERINEIMTKINIFIKSQEGAASKSLGLEFIYNELDATMNEKILFIYDMGTRSEQLIVETEDFKCNCPECLEREKKSQGEAVH